MIETFALSELEAEALALSLRVALWSVVGSLPFAVAVAWLLARRQFPGKALVDALVHLPLVLPPVTVGYLLLYLFGRRGPVGAWLDATFGITFAFNWKGAALASSVMAFPLVVRAIRLAIEAVDRRLEAAARSLGANGARIFATITLPLAAPGLIAGTVLGFARSLGEFGATISFVANIPGETQTLPLAVYTLMQAPGGESGAIRLMLLSVAVSLLALIASEMLARRVAARMGS